MTEHLVLEIGKKLGRLDTKPPRKQRERCNVGGEVGS